MCKSKIFALFTVYCLLFTVCLPAFAQGNDARIIYVKGRVELLKALEAQYITAEEGMPINNGDSIRTYPASTAEIAFDKDGDNAIRIQPNSEFIFEGVKAKKTELPNGKVFALLESLERDSSFEVRTPTAVCGVAGSGIFVSTDGDKTTTGCHEDASYAKGINKDGSLTEGKTIKAGYKSIIGKFKAPGPLLKLTGQEKKSWGDFKEDLKEHLKPKEEGDERNITDRIKKLQGLINKRGGIRREDSLERREQERRDEGSSGDGDSNPS